MARDNTPTDVIVANCKTNLAFLRQTLGEAKQYVINFTNNDTSSYDTALNVLDSGEYHNIKPVALALTADAEKFRYYYSGLVAMVLSEYNASKAADAEKFRSYHANLKRRIATYGY